MHQIKLKQLVFPLLLTLAILLPYWRLTLMGGLLVTDDGTVSDVFNGELPPRFHVGEILSRGEAPVWTNQICGGFPLATAATDPVSLLLFTVFPLVVAHDLQLLLILLIAAHGAYALTRRIGARPVAATLAGLSFAYSGYMVCQLKHIAIASTVCWLPLGLYLLELVFARRADEAELGGSRLRLTRHRLGALVVFSAILALQILSGFPQSVYICGLLYAAYALVRASGLRGMKLNGRPLALALLGLSMGACLVALLAGAAFTLPMWELSKTSERWNGLPFAWASVHKYWPSSAITFLIPYANGDASDLSFKGKGIFWEDYGYVGLLTVVFALVGVFRDFRKVHVRFFLVAGIIAFLLVLGPSTPVYRLAFHWLPGMNRFRLPTRFLVVVELSICVLAGIGLSGVLTYLEDRLKKTNRAVMATYAGLVVVGITAVDLVYHQMRQNAIVDAYTWLEPPIPASILQKEAAGYRVYSLFHGLAHLGVHQDSRGWRDTSKYFALRDFIEPNSNLFWGIATADCYAGLAPAWYSYVWGNQNSKGLITPLHSVNDGRALKAAPAFFRILRANSVKYILTTLELEEDQLTRVQADSPIPIYEVKNVLPRAFIVTRAFGYSDDRSAAERMVAKKWDPADSVVLLNAPVELTPPIEKGSVASANQWTARITKEGASELTLDIESENPGFLVLNDTFYPGWHAQLDGVDLPIYRANLTNKAIQIPAGAHRVAFRFESKVVRIGFAISAFGFLLGIGAGFLVWSKKGSKVPGLV